MHIDFTHRPFLTLCRKEIFPFVEDIVHVRKRYPVFPEELEGVLQCMYPEDPSQQEF